MAVKAGGRAKLEYGDQGNQRTPKKVATNYSRRSFATRLGLFCCALPVTAIAQQDRVSESAFSVGRCRH